MHACPLERSDIILNKAFAFCAPSRLIAALSAVPAAFSHRAVTCFPPAETATFPVCSGWLS